jgi:hypothetical protein
MSSSPSSDHERRWRFTAAYRLGNHWQKAGDYVRAQAAYREALTIAPAHRASLLNLAVTQIRLQAYEAARDNLVELCRRDKTLPSNPQEGVLEPQALPVVYNRALVLRYLGELGEAKAWSERVAVAAYRRGNDKVVDEIASSALMLHAGILLDLQKDDDALLNRAVTRALARPGHVADHKLVLDPTMIEWYVRGRLGSGSGADARGHYNLACYLARLMELVPQRAAELAPVVAEHVDTAFGDTRLAPWAEHDPALDVMRSRPEWRRLRGHQEDAPSSADAEPATAPPPQATTPERARVVNDTLAVLTGVHADAEERRARRSRDPLERLKALKEPAADLDAAEFHLELVEAVAGLWDPVTAYLAPSRIHDRISALPLKLVEARDEHGEARIFVSAVDRSRVDIGLTPGVEVSHWNGVPIEEVIAARTALVAAPDLEGRRARSIATLTHRPSGVFAPLDADEVAIRCGIDRPRDVHVEWDHLRVPPSATPQRLQSTDPLVAAIDRAASRPREITAEEFEGPGGSLFGHLQIPTFDVTVSSRFVADVAARLEQLPSTGLVLDVRGNAGGSIAAAERLLQLFSPRPVKPQLIQLRATSLTAQLAEAVPGLWSWSRSVKRAIARGEPFSKALPVAPDQANACNDTGRAFEGPVVLLIDALCAGATDMFIAGFVDHGLGTVLSTAARGGMAGGVSWRTDDPTVDLPRPLHRLTNGGALQITVARTLTADGRPHAEHPVVPGGIRRLRTSEVQDGDGVLLRHAASTLAASR